MDGLNLLIAQGGGYKPPMDLLEAARQGQQYQLGKQELQGNALRNQLMGQEIGAQPYQRMLDEKEMNLKALALDVKAKALELKGKKSVTIDYPTFSISGDADNVAEVADAVSNWPDQANHPKFGPWVAQKGVSIKIREQKAYAPTTQEEALGFEQKKLDLKRQYEQEGLQRGTVFTDDQGNMIQPFYDKQGNLKRALNLGKSQTTTTTDTKMLDAKIKDGTNFIRSLLGMTEFSNVDPETADKAAAMGELYASYQKENPSMDYPSLAHRAYRKVNAQFKATGEIPKKRDIATFGTEWNFPETIKTVKNSLRGGITDIDAIVDALEKRGWDRKEAVDIIRAAKAQDMLESGSTREEVMAYLMRLRLSAQQANEILKKAGQK
jgi:hypothetical protein